MRKENRNSSLPLRVLTSSPKESSFRSSIAFLLVILCFSLTWSACNIQKENTQRNKQIDAAGRFTTIQVDLRTERLEIFLRDDHAQPLKNFDNLRSWLAGRNLQLRFAMNAGMFKPDLSPVGLLVQDGREVSPITFANGEGNFFLKPNGVFLVSGEGPKVVESSEYPALARDVRFATQSGPLLVRNGVIHPAFKPDSASKLIRNGVGVAGDKIFFVISDQPVNFYEMAAYFRDELHCPDALYLDGVVSGLYSMELMRNDNTTDLGPLIGVVAE